MSEPAPADAAGLSSAEAERRLGETGPNEIPDRPVPLWRRVLQKFSAPVPWMLEAAILLQSLLHEFIEAAVIALLLGFNAALGLIQEGRAQATLRALKARLAVMAVARRDGQWHTVPAQQVVPGDVLKLSLGSIVPADVRLLEGEVLLDQSLLTGESLPVEGSSGTLTYAGALVRRGEALAVVTATGVRTRFGRTAELVQVADSPSAQQRTVLQVVRNLAIFSGALVIVQMLYAGLIHLPSSDWIPLLLTAVLAAIPVALPASFTLASAIAARTLAARGVLPTRLSAIDEAAAMDVLCSDKTGTLTQNSLAVAAMRAAAGFSEADLLALGALASADAGLDPVDAAVRTAGSAAGRGRVRADLAALERTAFVPFDPAHKWSEARVREAGGAERRVLKGAVARIAQIAPMPGELEAAALGYQRQGYRVLGVAFGPPEGLACAGLIALNDPPRTDARALIGELRAMGVRTVMITGDAAVTAEVVAQAVGLQGATCPPGAVPDRLQPADFAVYAGVFPEDKFHIVRAMQATGHTVGMCGDGANDAPALRQAQMGIAVASATDIAKSAAGLVLTQPGLGGVVEAVRCGRMTYQRILTYTLRSMTAKLNQMLFLTVGLVMTGQAVLTPMLMVIVMISGDFLALSATTDRVRTSSEPDAWRVGRISLTAIVLALCSLGFCTAVLAIGTFKLGLAHRGLRTLAAVALVCSSQAAFYVVRDRRHLWSSRPGSWVILCSILDVAIIALLAGRGILIHPLPWPLIGAVVLGAALLALLLDGVRSLLALRVPLT